MAESSEDTLLSSRDLLAALRREVPVRVLNFSGSGCLIESRHRVEPGTIATLRLVLKGEEFSDDVQVVRCQPIEGAGSVYHVGVQFVWTAPPHSRALRSVMVVGRKA